jgi:hypothetical protein
VILKPTAILMLTVKLTETQTMTVILKLTDLLMAIQN